jgi:hypothetical protein
MNYELQESSYRLSVIGEEGGEFKQKARKVAKAGGERKGKTARQRAGTACGEIDARLAGKQTLPMDAAAGREMGRGIRNYQLRITG